VLIYRFNASLFFFNAEYFKERVLAVVTAERRPIEWLILDASPVNHIDITALEKLGELDEELAARGVSIVVANREPHLMRYFRSAWRSEREKRLSDRVFPTIDSALEAHGRSK
jgi:MFS superfamily sulfate permease-like transporter